MKKKILSYQLIPIHNGIHNIQDGKIRNNYLIRLKMFSGTLGPYGILKSFSKLIAYLRFHAWGCTLYEFGQMYNDMHSSTALKIL